jgi:outer membrane biogenesis lipoprotein LolB
MYLIKLKLLLVSSLLLAACSTTVETQPVINTQPIVITPENPRPINTRPVEFIVVTESNRTKLDNEPVWYAMTTGSYENLAYNMQQLIRYISQQQSQINYYRNITSN